MKLSRLFPLAIIAAIAFVVAGCNNDQPQGNAAITEVTVFNNPEISCPVPPDQLETVLSGAYGVDGLSRPVNAHGYPVDTEGHCVTASPVQHVFYDRPSPLYINYFLLYHPGYVWVSPAYRPLYTPGIIVLRDTRPSGHVSTLTNYKAPGATTTTTIRPGASQTVRPGSAAQPASTSHPVAPVAPAAPAKVVPAPATIAPSGGAASQMFNRGPAPAAAPAAPARAAAPIAAPVAAPRPSISLTKPSISKPSISLRKH